VRFARWFRVRQFLAQRLKRQPKTTELSTGTVLAEGHDLYRELFENGQGLICIHDFEGRLEEVNPAAAHLLGYEPAELVGRSLADVLSPEGRSEMGAYLARLRQEERVSGLMRVVTRQGDEQIWMYRNVRIDRPGRPPAVLGYGIDVTERRRAEQAREAERQLYMDRIERQNIDLELRNREIEKADRLKSAFLDAMSHELRTPLTSIMGFSDLLAEDADMTAQQQLYLGYIRQGSRHLLQLINDVLDFSKIEAGSLDLTVVEVELDRLAAETVSTIDPLAVQREIQLESDVPPGLTVRADRHRLKQVLLNLLGNAIKFTPAGGVVRLTASRQEGAVAVAVQDTGIGIPPEEHEMIFAGFHQVGCSTRGIREGAGLGLAIVRRLIEQQGGKIWVESEPGQGSRFTFRLPASQRVPAACSTC
jgi:PAS domain S-box-containing protein